MPTLIRFIILTGGVVGLIYVGLLALANNVNVQPREMTRNRRNPESAEMNARAPRWIDDFLDAIAAERGAARNTIEAYRRDLTAYLDFLKSRGRGALEADDDDIRAFQADGRRGRARQRLDRAPALRRAPVPQASLSRGAARRRSDARDRGPAPRAPAAEGAGRRRGRAPVQTAREGLEAPGSKPAERAWRRRAWRA